MYAKDYYELVRHTQLPCLTDDYDSSICHLVIIRLMGKYVQTLSKNPFVSSSVNGSTASMKLPSQLMMAECCLTSWKEKPSVYTP